MTRIEVFKGDITKLEIDAIVNAANSSLLGGGGVDGAIHRAGGPQILEECQQIRAKQGKCKTGEAVITSAGKLPSKYVIHTVGPIYNGKINDDKLLTNAYINSLKLAEEYNIKTIAFPNISTGIYKFPKERAAFVATQAVNKHIEQGSKIERIVFVCFDDESYDLYKELI
ncbi:MAG: O-acetyl-ADP-ribose deacetylase [Hyphomicrobiales bacterium]